MDVARGVSRYQLVAAGLLLGLLAAGCASSSAESGAAASAAPSVTTPASPSTSSRPCAQLQSTITTLRDKLTSSDSSLEEKSDAVGKASDEITVIAKRATGIVRSQLDALTDGLRSLGSVFADSERTAGQVQQALNVVLGDVRSLVAVC